MQIVCWVYDLGLGFREFASSLMKPYSSSTYHPIFALLDVQRKRNVQLNNGDDAYSLDVRFHELFLGSVISS